MDDLIQVNAIITQGTDLLSNYYYDYELFNYYCALHNEGSVRAKNERNAIKKPDITDLFSKLRTEITFRSFPVVLDTKKDEKK